MNKKNVLLSMIVKVIVFIFMFFSVYLILKQLTNGIVIGKNDFGDLIYSSLNKTTFRAFNIVALMLLVKIFIFSIFATYFNNKHTIISANQSILIEAVLLSLLIIINIINLFIFPLAQDKRNSYAFGFSLSNIIVFIILLIKTISRLFRDKVVTKLSVNVISESAIMGALAVILSLFSKIIPGLELPTGGSFSLSMLPLVIFGFRRGYKAGFILGFVYGLLNFLTDGLILHWGSIFFDYLLPFSILTGISGLFSEKASNGSTKAIVFGVLLAGFSRYLLHGLSGVIFFSEYAGSNNAWFYSFILYNLPYMLVSTIATLILSITMSKNFINIETRIR